MTYFTGDDLVDIESLRQAYRIQAIRLHPDKHEESESERWTIEFRMMQAEYESALSQMSREAYTDGKTTFERERILQDMIDRLMEIPKIEIDLAGCWLWVTGNTWRARRKLLGLGFKWSKNKKSWYWGLTMRTRGGKQIKPKFGSVQDVFAFYGRERIGGSDAQEQLLIGGS